MSVVTRGTSRCRLVRRRMGSVAAVTTSANQPAPRMARDCRVAGSPTSASTALCGRSVGEVHRAFMGRHPHELGLAITWTARRLGRPGAIEANSQWSEGLVDGFDHAGLVLGDL